MLLNSVLLLSPGRGGEVTIGTLWILITLFGIIGIALLISVFFKKQFSNFFNIRNLNAKSKSESLILDLVFGDKTEPLKHEKWLFASDFRKNVLIREIIKLKKDLYGHEATVLENYYKESGLVKLSLSKIRSSRKLSILVGLNELVTMNSAEYVKEMATLYYETLDSESKNYLLTSILKLNPLYGLKLVLKSNHFLTDWFQLIIIKSLDEVEFTKIPPLHLFEEKGGSVAILGHKLASYLASKEEYVVGDIQYDIDLDLDIVIKDTFTSANVLVQNQILNNLLLLGTDITDYGGLKAQIVNAPSQLLRYLKNSLKKAFEA